MASEVIAKTAIIVNQRLPDFPVTDMRTKEKMNLYDIVKQGKVTAIIFYVTWCPACAPAVDAFNRSARRFKNKVNIMSICMDQSDPALKLASSRNWDKIPLLQVSEDDKTRVSKLFGLRYIPHCVLTNKYGVIVKNYQDFEAGNDDQIERLMRYDITDAKPKAKSSPKARSRKK